MGQHPLLAVAGDEALSRCSLLALAKAVGAVVAAVMGGSEVCSAKETGVLKRLVKLEALVKAVGFGWALGRESLQ